MPAHRGLPLAMAAAAAALLLPAPDRAEAVRFEIKGAGWGHGVGMSQWGARGYAKHGRDHKRILEHYYRHTRVGQTEARKVSVLLRSGPGTVRFSGASAACGSSLDESREYRADRAGPDVLLRRAGGEQLENCGRELQAQGRESIRVEGKGTYRGDLVVRARSGGGLAAINAVNLEAYVQGVVPNEMPSNWPAEALRAQAVAARSYALATSVRGEGFDHYDDTRSQVYGGKSSETGATNAAVMRTDGQVVRHGKEVATTFFFSSSGGRTENSEYGFVGGESRPYLKSVDDRYDRASPYHRWKVAYTRHEIENRLGGLVEGRLRKIEVTKRGRSPRIVRARVRGSAGSTAVNGLTLQSRLDLRSTWARFEKKG
ncbi:MAG TPA: SpoIID/LytB domain-containing protein [Solirubrobacterales bacterium]|nr:SpoIID/LytB domain-containing protein [Solirubrobacterales bacterium]